MDEKQPRFLARDKEGKPIWLTELDGDRLVEFVDRNRTKGKGTQQIGWTLSPTIMSWPGVIPREKRFNGLSCTLDFYATIAAAAGIPAPNLIVIMTDDMGYADVGFNGCRDIPTPNIDRLAEDGVRCTSGYVGYSVCGPSRAAFMTGRYGQRFGFERNPQYRTQDPNMGREAISRKVGAPGTTAHGLGF